MELSEDNLENRPPLRIVRDDEPKNETEAVACLAKNFGTAEGIDHSADDSRKAREKAAKDFFNATKPFRSAFYPKD
jgi:hypothetical protein